MNKQIATADVIKRLVNSSTNPAGQLVVGSGSSGQWGSITPEDLAEMNLSEYKQLHGIDADVMQELRDSTADGTDIGNFEDIAGIFVIDEGITKTYLVIWE